MNIYWTCGFHRFHKIYDNIVMVKLERYRKLKKNILCLNPFEEFQNNGENQNEKNSNNFSRFKLISGILQIINFYGSHW